MVRQEPVQYGFFGVSSWYGIGLWRVVLFRYESEELTPLLADGTLHQVVTVNPFSLPSRYRHLGYVGASEVPSLSRNDFHNVNVPAISVAYGRSARRLVLRDPLHYLGNVLIGYGNFSSPSTESDHLIQERYLMGAHVTLWRALTGLPLVRVLDRAIPIGTLESFFLVLIPLGLVALAGVVGRRLRRGEGIEEVLREEAALIGAGALILSLYGTGGIGARAGGERALQVHDRAAAVDLLDGGSRAGVAGAVAGCG